MLAAPTGYPISVVTVAKTANFIRLKINKVRNPALGDEGPVSADGFLGAAVFDTQASACVAALEGSSRTNVQEEVVGHAELVLAKRRTIANLKLVPISLLGM